MDNEIESLPVWREKENLTSDLVEIIRPRVSIWVRDNHKGMLRAILKEVVQAGYRKAPEEPKELEEPSIDPQDMSPADAIKVLTAAMQDVELGSLAHAWHCNIAMAVYDSAPKGLSHAKAHKMGNEAATRFMKLLFDVNTTNNPSKPKREDK